MNTSTTILALLAIIFLPASAGALTTDPVPPDQIPGASVPGVVVVDDGDGVVVREPAAKPVKIAAPPENDPTYGGTGLLLNGYNQVGDGKTSITVSPKLPAGRYAVWIRFVRMARNWHGSAESAVVKVNAKDGEWRYSCSPRQGGQWTFLGAHELSGIGPALTMRNEKMQGVVTFDAAVFVPTEAAPPRGDRYLPPAGDALATIVRRAADAAIGPTEAPPRDAVVAQRLRERDFAARLDWDTLIRTPDRTRLWGDTLATSSHLLTRDAARIAAMAAAWAGASEIDSLGMRGNPRLLADVLDALDTFLTHRWTPTTKWDVNWFDFEIGVPRGVFAALCVLGPHASKPLNDKAAVSMRRFSIDPWKYYNNGFESTGANRVWMVENHIRRAALAGDAKGLERCRDGLPPVMAYVDADPAHMPKSRDGWYRDGSFIQHGKLPYVGAYGVLLIPDLVSCLGLLEGTPWTVNAPQREHLPEWLDLHLLPVQYEGELFPRTTGRTAGSEGVETANQWLAIALAELRPFLSPQRAAEVTSRLRRWIDAGTLDPRFSRADFEPFLALHAIATDPSIKPAPPYVASRTHAAVDLALHHRPGWAATVAMSSTRTASHEALWGANFRGWNQGEGVLMVYPADPLRYRGGFWALVDPYRLPGITTNTWKLPDHDGGGSSPGKPSKADFVGGASLDDLASVAVMRIAREWSSLQGNKAWFLFPDAIVCLGSGITADEDRPAQTIVENARLRRGDLEMTIDAKPAAEGDFRMKLETASTIHLAGERPEQAIGWWFPAPQPGLVAERSTRSGSWADANKKATPAPLSQPWLTLSIDHGSAPRNAGYAYVVLPGISAGELAELAKTTPLEISANTPKVQAVYDRRHGLTGVVFHSPGSFGPISVDQPCVILLHQGDQATSLAIADPTQKLQALTITLANPPTGSMAEVEHVRVDSQRPLRLIVDLKDSLGYERTVRWSR